MSKDIQAPINRTVPFDTYRFQLLVDNTIQQDAFNGYESIDAIRKDKNNILKNIFTKDAFSFKSSTSEISSKLMYTEGEMYYFKVNVRRTIKWKHKDFTTDTLENYPNITLAFNNDPSIQKIAIQNSTSVFKDTTIATHFVQDTLNEMLKEYGITMFTEPLYDKQDFWKLIRLYPKQIKQITFDLISPNLPEISKNLQLDLRGLNQDTNTIRTKLELNAEKEGHLDIKESSKYINSLVDYSADGGGNIKMKVEGIRKMLNTAENNIEFAIDKELLETDKWEELHKQFQNFVI